MSLINSKLDDFFGLSEYDWTPATRENAPSMYLYELVNWLTTVVDSLQISDSYKDEAYRAATAYIEQSFMVRLSPVLRRCFKISFIFHIFSPIVLVGVCV
jgi:hypothetical protein